MAARDARRGADAGPAARAPEPGPVPHLGLQVGGRGGRAPRAREQCAGARARRGRSREVGPPRGVAGRACRGLRRAQVGRGAGAGAAARGLPGRGGHGPAFGGPPSLAG